MEATIISEKKTKTLLAISCFCTPDVYSLLFKSRQLLGQFIFFRRSQFCPMVQVSNKKKISMDEDDSAHERKLKEHQTPLAQLPGNL